MDAPEFTLRLEGIEPGDLPMRRLAGYLDAFARLLGEEASTRFVDVRPGSVCLVAKPLPAAVPKVRKRLAEARQDGASVVVRIVDHLDEMMADDNVSGSLREEGRPGIVIRFPGATGRGAAIPAIAEDGMLQGELVRIGGKDTSAHAQLRDGDRIYTCSLDRDTARRLSRHLYGSIIRAFGRGRWRRSSAGTWEPIEFKMMDFQVVDDASLAAAADRLQKAGGLGVRNADEIYDELQALRTD